MFLKNNFLYLTKLFNQLVNSRTMKHLKEDTEHKIIVAAREVFIEKGLEGARMQEIADKAGINKSLLHYYFRSKDKMFDAVFQDIIGKVIPEFSKMIKSEQPMTELMTSFISFYNDFFMANPFLPQFFFHEIWQHPDKLAAFIQSQKIEPKMLAKSLEEKLPPVAGTVYLPQHMIANVLGMTLFPHIARPLFQRLFFDNNDEKYNQFLLERTDFLVKLLTGLNETDVLDKIQAPDEDF